MGQEVKIKIRAFPYYEDVEDPISGETRPVERIARRGDVVELDGRNLERAKRFEAIVEPDAELEEPGAPPAPPESAEDLARWIESEKPTVDEVVDRAGNDPDVAQRLIDAENLATGQQPRTTLVEKLEEIVAKGNE